MRRIIAPLIALCAGCTPQQQQTVDTALANPAGQLFCAIQTGGGGAVVVGLVNAAVSGAAPPLAVIATGASKAFVDAACAQARGILTSTAPLSKASGRTWSAWT